MKKILGLVLSFTAFGATDPLEFGKYYEGRNPESVNYIKNSSCFKGVANITGTNTTPSKNTTTPLTSYSDCQSTLDSATDTVEWSANTLDRSLKNGNCEVGIRYKLTLGSGNTIQLQARINSATVASADLVTSDNGTATVNFPCGDLSNAPSLRIAQTAGSSSQAINVSNVYLGAARNIGTVAQASFVGSVNIPVAASCEWSNNTSTFTTPAADADCTLGTATGSGVTAIATKQPGITINSLSPGNYVFRATGAFYKATASSNSRCFFRFSDGTNSTASNQVSTQGEAIIVPVIEGRLSVTTGSSSATFYIQAANDGASPVCEIDARNAPLEISVYRFPSSSEIAVRNGQNPAWGSSLLSKGSITSAQYTTTTWTTINNVGYTGQTFIGNATATTSSGDLGIKLPSLPAGTYQIIAQGGFYSTSSSVCVFGFYDGTTREVAGYVGSTPGFSPTLAGVFTYTSQADRNIVLQVHSFSTATLCGVDVGDGANVNAPTFRITVFPISQAIPSPILVGSVTSNSTGAERVERLRFGGASDPSQCTSDPCTIYSKSLSSVTVTWSGTGLYRINWPAGTWSAIPSCVAIAKHPGTNMLSAGSSAANADTVTASWLSIVKPDTNTTTDATANVICMGPR